MTRARLRALLAVYGIVLGLACVPYLERSIEPRAGISPERLVQLDLATGAAEEGLTPLLALSPPPLPAGTSQGPIADAWELPFGDAAGPYVVFPGIALAFDVQPATAARWAFILCWLLLVATAPLVFFGLFDSVLAAVGAPLLAISQADVFFDTGLAWVGAWALLFGGPIALLAARIRDRLRLPVLGLVAVIAGIAELLSPRAGIPLIALLLLVTLLLPERPSVRMTGGLVLLCGFLVAAFVAPAAVERTRDVRAPENRIHSPDPAAKRWESLYTGLGYLHNDRAITTSADSAVAHVTEETPRAAYLDESYERTVRRLYLDVWRENWRFALETLGAKAQATVRDALDHFGAVLLLVPLIFASTSRSHRLRRQLGRVLAILPLTAVAPIVFLPTSEHETTWLGAWALLWLLAVSMVVAYAAPALRSLGASPWRRSGPTLRRGARNLAQSPGAGLAIAVLVLPLVLTTGPLAASLDREAARTFYVRSTPTQMTRPAEGGRVMATWTFRGHVPDDWRVNVGTEIEPASRAIRVSTSPARFADQLLAPERNVPRGEYLLEVGATVLTGGMTASVLDADRGRWIKIGKFWYGGQQQDPIRIRFTLIRARRIQVVLTNYAPRDARSTWTVRSVELRRLKNAPIIYRDFRFGPG